MCKTFAQQAQLSLQETIGFWTDVKVRWTKTEGQAGMLDAQFDQLSCGINHFLKFRKFFLERFDTLTITDFEQFPLSGVETLTIKNQKNLWARGNPNFWMAHYG